MLGKTPSKKLHAQMYQAARHDQTTEMLNYFRSFVPNPDVERYDYQTLSYEQLTAINDPEAWLQLHVGHNPNGSNDLLKKSACAGHRVAQAFYAMSRYESTHLEPLGILKACADRGHAIGMRAV
jgi:hypothetical protein